MSSSFKSREKEIARKEKRRRKIRAFVFSEEFGGVTPVVVALLLRLSKKTGTDGTRYGMYSTRDFVSHHATAISMAIVTGAATAIVDGISKLETRAASTASPARHS